MRAAMRARLAWLVLVALALCGDITPATRDTSDGFDVPATFISTLLEEQWRLLDPLLAATALAGTLLGAWNGYLRRQIAKRQRAERALENQVAFMRTLINGTPYPIYVRDENHRLLACNARYLDEIGATRSCVMGRTMAEAQVVPVELATRLQAVHDEALRQGRAIFADRDCVLRGTPKKIHHWVLPYKDPRGRTLGTIGGWIDVSDRVRLLQALQHAKDGAESANRAKSDFVATASHEIRTPLNAIAGMLELALKGGASAQEVQDCLQIAHGSAQALLGLVGDILDLERIESGRLDLLPEPADLRQLAESAVRVFAGIAHGKGIDLNVHVGKDADARVLVDATRFKQIVSNLVSNAVKFTPRGHVEVRLDAQRRGPAQLAVTVQVVDTGIGIGEADQQQLFQPFMQTRDGARIFGGSGLGLCIARRLAVLMGGTLMLEGTPGQGCVARFEFVATRLAGLPQRDDAPLIPRAPLPALQVLAVDDNEPSRMLLRKQFEHLGHRVVQAPSGKAAWRLWRPGMYDLVMTDCNMIDGSGYALAQRIRQAESQSAARRCTLWAYTANARQEEVERCREAGMDACVFKPMNLAALQQRLEHHFNAAGTSHAVRHEELRFDPSAIDSMMGDAVLADRFLAELPQANDRDAQTLREALERGCLDGMRAAIHAIRGVALMVDARALAQACTTAQEVLERACAIEAARHACAAVLAQSGMLSRSMRAWTARVPDILSEKPGMWQDPPFDNALPARSER
jgi:two-component system sensor histidine kinase EvgS